MRYVNVLWPSDLETEYLSLFSEYCDIAEAEGIEDEQLFSKKVNDYIEQNASVKLKEWFKRLEKLEKQPA
ncbi:MAG: hypothetical protein IKR85_02910 [Clostridia bacterium]|nr:hypothetical protein [Clostridia bacterium]